METFDLIIIGAGPGGYETAVYAAHQGLSVAIVEEGRAGGTCLQRGCIPTKCLAHTAEMLDEMHHAATLGITLPEGTLGIDLNQVMARTRGVIDTLTAGIDGLLSRPGITRLSGHGSLSATDTVCVTTADGQTQTISAPHIIIATGSRPRVPAIVGADLPGVVTSDDMFRLTSVPRRLCVVGGGVIGLEFAGIFASFGSAVSVVEFCKEVVPNLDRDMAKRLRTAMKKRGINFATESAVKGIVQRGDELVVTYEKKGKSAEVVADLVLMAVGRGPQLEGIGLETVGIDFTPRGITVDANMQTSVAGLYAIGDVNGLCQLAHAASFQGRRAVNHILGRDDEIDFTLIPSAVYTVPSLASVGVREEDFEATGQEPVIVRKLYRANGRALTMGAEEGCIKLIARPSDGRIVGVHILGASASELIHEAAVLIRQGATLAQLRDIIHAHPTLSELYLAD